MLQYIKIRGARQHNLKNVDLDIPKNKLVVFTGVSGSGKSSLAFDTIYAEGQRRYVESLSAYARQFLGVMDKPDVDLIEGLSPSISIDQKTASHNPRSTVGTITEIYDYLRVLYARVGHPHCPICQKEISKLSVDEIVEKIMTIIGNALKNNKIVYQKFTIMSPVVRSRKGEFRDLLKNLQSKGYMQVRVDKQLINIADEIELIKTNKHNIEAIIDTLVIKYSDWIKYNSQTSIRSRLNTAVEQSVNLSDGLVLLAENQNEHLFSQRFSCPHCNLAIPEIEPRMFSFNSPLGACEKCKGIGTILRLDIERAINPNLTINEGGIAPFSRIFYQDTWYIRLLKQVAKEEGIDFNVPLKNLDNNLLKILFYGTDKIYRVAGTNRQGRPTVIYEKFDGIANELERRFYDASDQDNPTDWDKYMREETCPSCRGARLKPEVLSITIDKKNIAQLSDLSVDYLSRYLKDNLMKILTEYEKQIAKPIIKEVDFRLSFLRNVGLGYLTISRTAKTLSGGELQRIRLASQIGSGLTGVLYVLDEPSIGLHPKDVSALLQTLKQLKNLGNTLIVVEHDKETIESADYIVELGPRAGKDGGKVVFHGTVEQLKKNKNSLTGSYLSGEKIISINKKKLVKNRGEIKLIGASQFNLKKINVSFPLGNLIVITGVSGSGKSTLISETLYPALKYYLEGYWTEQIGEYLRIEGYQYINRVYLVDQSPIGRTPRSNVATYVGFFDEIREIFAQTREAKAAGFSKGRFSFNIRGGRCEKCQGAGTIKIEMQFLSDVYIKCDVCDGKRYNKETLAITFKNKTIYDILNMTVDEVAIFFQNYPNISHKLKTLQQIGLGYIELGQPAPTFSGGEAQRIKLANELSHKEIGKTLYILDEPTTGLHFADIQKLLTALNQLVDHGNTVVIIEHNLEVIKNAQYIIDLGPDGGDNGGNVVYQGELAGIIKAPNSYTGLYLRKILKNIPNQD